MDDSVKQSIEAFENRVIHRRLDPAILASIADRYVEIAIVDYVDTKLQGQYEREAHILAALPTGIRALYLTWGVQAEVNNGGFNQYYWNSEGRFAEQAVTAFEFFSAHEYAQLMREANRIHLDESTAIDEFKEEGTLEAFSRSYAVSKLGSLDSRFYDLGDTLSELRIAKIRAEPLLFSAE